MKKFIVSTAVLIAFIVPATASAATPAQSAHYVLGQNGKAQECKVIHESVEVLGYGRAKAIYDRGNVYQGRVFDALVSICA